MSRDGGDEGGGQYLQRSTHRALSGFFCSSGVEPWDSVAVTPH